MKNRFLTNRTAYFLRKLEANTPPLWGNMTAQHTIEHLSGLVYISIGRFQLKPFFSAEKTIAFKAEMLTNDRPLPRNMPVPATGLLPLRFASLDEAKEKLMAAVTQFFQFFSQHPDAKPLHPAFGELNKEEWEWMHQKHFSYHFEQFGLGKHIFSPYFLKHTIKEWLQHLQADTQPQWGQMTAQHTIEHLSGLVAFSRKDSGMTSSLSEEEQDKQKRFIWSNRPFPKHIPLPGLAPGKLRDLRFPDLDTAKARLFSELDTFYAHYQANPLSTEVHPLFGPLNKEEWEQFHSKHFMHHIGKQFGLEQ